MPSKLFYLDGASGTVFIGDYDIDKAGAISTPGNYLSKLNFHSGLNYLQIKGTITNASLTFTSVVRNVATWSSSGCGGC